MKKTVFLGILWVLSPMIVNAQNAQQVSEPQKIHLDFSQLSITEQGIFAFVSNNWVPVNTLYSDIQGFLAVIETRWICPRCLYNNSARAKTCERWYEVEKQYCGYPRP